MAGVVAAIAVAVFGFLFAWSDLIRELGGKRLATFISFLSVLSMWLAFKLDPDAAIEVVMKPGEELLERFGDQLRNIGNPTTTTTVPAQPESP